MTRRARLSLLAVLATACGGSAPPGAASPNAAAAQQQVAAEPPPDLSPVTTPADLVLAARLRDPGNLLDTIGTWASFPLDWRGLIAQQAPGVDKLIAWDAPIEVAVVLDAHSMERLPQPFAVVSIGLISLDAAVKLAKSRGFAPKRLRPGVFHLAAVEAPSCAVAAALGRAPARLVCGDRPEDVEALLPYATRGLPNEPLVESDLHVELRVEPLRRRYGRQLRQLKTLALPFVLKQMSLDSPRFDRALADAAHAVADELLLLSDDLRTASVDVRVQRDAGQLEAIAQLDFLGTKSWTAGLLLAAASRAGAPPDTFWKLPASANAASFDAGDDPQRYTDIQRTLAELLGGFLEHEKAPRATVQRAVELAESAPLLGRATVYAEGSLPTASRASTDPAQRVLQDLGWRWVGFGERPNAWQRTLDGFTRLAGDATFRRILEQRFELAAGSLPRVQRRASRGMPPGSSTYEVALPPELAESGLLDALRKSSTSSAKLGAAHGAKPIKVVVVLVPDGDRTWLGIAADEATLLQPLRVVRQGAEAERLGSRSGLEWLRQLRASSGGFASVSSFVSQLADLSDAPQGDVRSALERVPSQGRTPIPYATTISRENGLKAALTLRVSKDVFRDLAALAPALAAARPVVGPVAPAPAVPPRRP